ncbi:MAG: radical SAM protein, partial [Myxococcales bacterium]|nr:radical SAM protein [Myxococcales bacterium]
MSTRATLRLTLDCDSACGFCGQGSRHGPLPFSDDALVALRERCDELSFVGGEPSLDPRLPTAIARARELGFVAVGLQSNGRRLAADDALFSALVAAGLSDLHLSIHGPTAEVHDYHSGRPGSFAAAM